jgi:hypothetical protein
MPSVKSGSSIALHAANATKKLPRSNFKEWLAVLDGLPTVCDPANDFAGNVGLDLVHQLHRLDDTEHLARFDLIAYLHECRCAGGG